MAAPAPPPFNININKAPETTFTKYNELRITGLYLHHDYHPDASGTHLTLLKPNGSNGFGATVANNWTIHNGPDPKVDAIVARAQGFNMKRGNWYNLFNIVFETDWLKGSTLQVMGVGVEEGDQWAIFSGTGHFTMAQGYINKKLHKRLQGENIIELDIYAIFRATKSHLKEEGPKGGSGGQDRKPSDVPHRLEVIKIRESAVIDSIEYTYLDQYGVKHTEGPWGGNAGPFVSTVRLDPTEIVKEVSGTVGQVNGADVISSLKFVTNLRTYGPYGKPSGNPFSLPEKEGGSVVGFTARTGEFVNAIGVLIRP
ncbi:unnamed protein product [Urochloa humidicola]